MSSYTILQDTSLELRRRIFRALQTAPDTDLGFGALEQDITLSPPSDDLQGTPRLSLFLYHIEPDGHLRNQHFLPSGSAGLLFPPFPVSLRYLITPLDDAEDQNQLVLGRIMQFLHDRPEIDRLDTEPLDNSFGGSSPELRISFEPLSMEQLSHVWSALNTAYRLSIAYNVRVVAVDSARDMTPARRVVDVHSVVGTVERGAGT
jgi:hypothetical protein